MAIRLRLTLWYSAVLATGLALFAVAMSVALEHRLMAGVDLRLEQRAEGLRAVADEAAAEKMSRAQFHEELVEFTQEVPEGALTRLSDAAGVLLEAPAGFSGLPPSDRAAYTTLGVAHRQFRVLATRIESGGRTYGVLAASSLDETRTTLRDFRRLLLTMIPGVLAIACLGGYWISRRALLPVDEITRVAGSISVQNLSARLNVPRTGDEIERMSKTWNEVLERLDRAVERIRQFTADASHELRTPLALISGTAELTLRRERGPEEYRRALRDIQDEAGRMTELTESLLVLARTDNRGAMPLVRVDLGEMVREVVSRSTAAALARGIAIRADAREPAVAMANSAGIRRVLLALVDNALKFTGPGGRVTVSAVPVEGKVRLAVEDTGEGIPAEALPHVFERFFRADPARSGSGTGLGLAIAQAIAEVHGSRITVASQPGEGTRFELALRASVPNSAPGTSI